MSNLKHSSSGISVESYMIYFPQYLSDFILQTNDL